MTLAALRNTLQIDGTAVPTVYEPICATDILYAGGMACLTAAGLAAPAASAASMSAVLGRVERTVDNSAGGVLRCRILAGQFKYTNSGTSITTADVGKLCYAVDDESVHISNAGGRPIAGAITRVDTDGVVFQTLFTEAQLAGAVVAAPTSSPIYHARGGTTANIAALATFTVANDGIVLVAGDRVLLRAQTAVDENGIYDVGVVAGGLAPLTRSLDFDDGTEIVNGAVVTIAEGTANEDTAWAVTSDSPIIVGTDNIVFEEAAFGYGAVGVMTAETIGQAAGAGVLHAAARIDHVHAMPASAVVVNTGAINVAGAAGTFADSAHIHAEHTRSVRGVATTNVADLGALVVAAFDGVTYVEGDLILLANQTVPAEAGVYVVGVVAGTAPLTRVAWMPAAAVLRGGYTVHVEEGTLFARTSWFIAEAGDITIAATAHTWYPETATFSLGIPADTGTITFATIPILSATKTNYVFTNAAEVTADATVRYGLNGAATPGVVGACTVTMLAELAAGTVNVDDDSTMIITVINR